MLVTHHVEEIPPGFTHAMLLREGKVVAQGPIEEALTVDSLAATFGISLRCWSGTASDSRHARRPDPQAALSTTPPRRRRTAVFATYDRGMAWLGDHPEVGWLVFALLLGGIEITTLDLTFAMLAVGALAGAAAGGLGARFLVQVIVAAAGRLDRHAGGRAPGRAASSAYSGREPHRRGRARRQAGPRPRAVDAHTGRIKLAGEIWSARSFDPSSVIEPGRTVDVIQIDGATAVVYESEP